jgi:oligopeptide/dipeptide ABC transporter ATP-binding protein
MLLKINKLNTRIYHKKSIIEAVCDFDLELKQKEILGIIGESGCGKTMSMLSITHLIPKSAKIISGEIYFSGRKINYRDKIGLRDIRGSQISYIFQDAGACLNPLFTIGEQIKEVFLTHNKLPPPKAYEATLEVLQWVNLKPAKQYYFYYPHQLSGGMNQRVMIAMSVASQPKLIIADEPTSSLDRITEIKILNLLKKLNEELNISIILISHNISIIKDFADTISVMYAGRIIEKASKGEVLDNPKHPYTKALLECIPKRGTELKTIEGSVPELSNLPQGCKFAPRCPFVMDRCLTQEPEIRNISQGHFLRCYLA